MSSQRGLGLDLQAPFVIHYRLPRAIPGPLHLERKASQSLPALAAPALSRAGRLPRGDDPEDFFVVHEPSTSASPWAGRSQKRVKAVDPPTWHPMPAHDPAITRARVSHAASSCACPNGLPAGPRSSPRHHPGLSVRGGPMREDGAANIRTDPPVGSRPDLDADAAARPRGSCASSPFVVAEMRRRSRITRFHF